MAKKQKQCKIKDCEQPLYVESKCYRHFKTEDRVKDSDEQKADGTQTGGGNLSFPAGVKAAEVVPERKEKVAGQPEKKDDKK